MALRVTTSDSVLPGSWPRAAFRLREGVVAHRVGDVKYTLVAGDIRLYYWCKNRFLSLRMTKGYIRASCEVRTHASFDSRVENELKSTALDHSAKLAI